MKIKGIRISDKKNRVVCVALPDILKQIPYGDLLYWSIQHFEARGNLGDGKSIPVFSKQINKSENGLRITWDELCLLASQLTEIIDILIIGCKNQSQLYRYDNDQQMYETCEFVIEMVDSGYWEVFSQNELFIHKIAANFKEIKFLDSNFEK